jgi:type II secretory pathway pseudopilin PulG
MPRTPLSSCTAPGRPNPPMPLRRGMTLLEVALAVLFFSLGSLALLQGLYLSRKDTQTIQSRQAFYNLIQGYADQVRGLAPSDLLGASLPLMGIDGQAFTWSPNVWNDIPQGQIDLVAPGGKLQVMPQVEPQTFTCEDGTTVAFIRVVLSYRYADNATLAAQEPSSWPDQGTLILVQANTDQAPYIAPTALQDLRLDTLQQAYNTQSYPSLFSPTGRQPTKPVPPVPAPLPPPAPMPSPPSGGSGSSPTPPAIPVTPTPPAPTPPPPSLAPQPPL